MWPLTNECEIEPVTPATFLVAEDGWKPLISKLLSKTYTIEGFVITLTWPRSRMMAGTVLVLGFEREESASEWRTALTNAIMDASAVRSPFTLGAQAETSEITQSESQEPANECVSGQASASASASDEIDTEADQAIKHKWRPLKELDGMVVYYEEDETGGAYMVSSVIRSNPKRVLDALTTGSFLLCCGDVSLVRREGDLEVLHLVLQPVGLGNWLLTPRELLLERVWTEYESGTLGILFKSCEQRASNAPRDNQPWWSWFTNPIEAYIPAAGFTISPVTPMAQQADSLLTMVLKIDFGGICSANHPLKSLIDGLGICQSWVDRILQTVVVLKNSLENETQLHATSSLLSCASLRRSGSSFRQNSLSGDLRENIVGRQNSLALENGVLNTKFWSNPGSAGFKVRGANYLTDRAKIPAAEPRFKLDWVYVLKLKEPTPNVSRFLPALRSGKNDFTFVIQVMIPGPPYLAMVIGWSNGEKNSTSVAEPTKSDPFESSFLRFLQSEDYIRDGMFKLIPKVVEGSWIIRRAVGNTPVIMGKKLTQSYHSGPGYFEVDIDIASSRTACAVIGIVQGATRSLTVDLGVLIQGDNEDELPESLIGTVRLDHVDMETAVPLDTILVED